MIVFVVDSSGDEWLYPSVARFATEDVTNNLMLMDDEDRLVGVWAEGRWSFVGVREQ